MRALRDTTVMFVSSRTGNTMSRAERRWLPVMAALRDEGAQVLLVAAMRGPLVAEARRLGVTVTRGRIDRLNIWITRNRLRALLRRHAPDVAVANGFWADVPLRLAAKDLAVHVVSEVTCGAWPERGYGSVGTWVRRQLERRTRERVDAFIADADALRESMIAEGVATSLITVIPPAVDVGQVVSAAREEAGLPGPGPFVGFAGSLERSRGLGTLAAAAPLIRERHPDVTVLVAGEGPARLSLFAAAVEGRVHLVGRVPSVPAVLSRMSVCVFPSNEPGVPASLLEAAALGRPIVATGVPGIAELFTDGVEALLVPRGDVRALADAVCALLDDSERALSLGAAARARVIDEHAQGRATQAYLRLLRALSARVADGTLP
jgi:glycosyltransferase involved in cell wall biosynthesis